MLSKRFISLLITVSVILSVLLCGCSSASGQGGSAAEPVTHSSKVRMEELTEQQEAELMDNFLVVDGENKTNGVEMYLFRLKDGSQKLIFGTSGLNITDEGEYGFVNEFFSGIRLYGFVPASDSYEPGDYFPVADDINPVLQDAELISSNFIFMAEARKRLAIELPKLSIEVNKNILKKFTPDFKEILRKNKSGGSLSEEEKSELFNNLCLSKNEILNMYVNIVPHEFQMNAQDLHLKAVEELTAEQESELRENFVVHHGSDETNSVGLLALKLKNGSNKIIFTSERFYLDDENENHETVHHVVDLFSGKELYSYTYSPYDCKDILNLSETNCINPAIQDAEIIRNEKAFMVEMNNKIYEVLTGLNVFVNKDILDKYFPIINFDNLSYEEGLDYFNTYSFTTAELFEKYINVIPPEFQMNAVDMGIHILRPLTDEQRVAAAAELGLPEPIYDSDGNPLPAPENIDLHSFDWLIFRTKDDEYKVATTYSKISEDKTYYDVGDFFSGTHIFSVPCEPYHKFRYQEDCLEDGEKDIDLSSYIYDVNPKFDGMEILSYESFFATEYSPEYAALSIDDGHDHDPVAGYYSPKLYHSLKGITDLYFDYFPKELRLTAADYQAE
ncbi:MAG: hypothetical protein ACOX68_05220 [Candidatus Limivicinus sp.]|jgi:hypothetical protein